MPWFAYYSLDRLLPKKEQFLENFLCFILFHHRLKTMKKKAKMKCIDTFLAQTNRVNDVPKWFR